MKVNALTVLICTALIAVFFAGCTAPQQAPVPVTTPATQPTISPTTASPSSLLSGTWTLVSVQGNRGATSIQGGTTITATFSDDGTVSGSAGCNNYVATYQASGKSLRIGKAATTNMLCKTPTGIMNQETIYLSNLQGASTFTITDGRMTVYDSAGKLLLTFQKGGPVLTPLPLGGITWNLEIYRGSSRANVPVLPITNVTAFFGPSGEITGSSGCNSYGGKFTTDGKTGISIGPLASTLMYCEGTGVMDQETAYLDLLRKAATYEVTSDGALVLRDKDGTILLRYLS